MTSVWKCHLKTELVHVHIHYFLKRTRSAIRIIIIYRNETPRVYTEYINYLLNIKTYENLHDKN